MTFQNVALCISCRATSVLLVINKVTFELSTIGPFVKACSIPFISLKLSFICSSVCKFKMALSLHLTLVQLSNVFPPIRKCSFPMTIKLAIDKASCTQGFIWRSESSLSSHFTILELTLI